MVISFPLLPLPVALYWGGGSVEDKLSDTGWINLPLENGFE